MKDLEILVSEVLEVNSDNYELVNVVNGKFEDLVENMETIIDEQECETEREIKIEILDELKNNFDTDIEVLSEVCGDELLRTNYLERYDGDKKYVYENGADIWMIQGNEEDFVDYMLDNQMVKGIDDDIHRGYLNYERIERDYSMDFYKTKDGYVSAI